MEQRLFFYPHKLEVGKGRAPGVPLDRKPKRVWTLYQAHGEDDLPELPMRPQHGFNAFLEDFVHDWNWRNGMFRYYSRVSQGEQWLLLEFEDETEPADDDFSPPDS
jgi:hypothetical protein